MSAGASEGEDYEGRQADAESEARIVSEHVEVGGVKVTQAMLDRMFSACREHSYLGIPSGYSPHLDLFARKCTGAVSTYERVLHDLIEAGTVPDWFKATFIRKAAPTPRKQPFDVLRGAGFPHGIYAIERPWELPTPRTIETWADELIGDCGPWLWVTWHDARHRACELARAAVVAAATIDGQITYKDASDLCEEVNSADMYGANSKHNVMMPYRRATLLVLDGIGTERQDSHSLEALNKVMRAREAQNMPTVIGSTMGIKQWLAGYRRFNQPMTDGLARSLVSGLCCYERLTGEERTKRIEAHVIGAATA